jgi:hypothetical protein
VALHEVILASVDFYRALDRGKFEVPLHEVRVVCVHKGVFSDVVYDGGVPASSTTSTASAASIVFVRRAPL